MCLGAVSGGWGVVAVGWVGVAAIGVYPAPLLDLIQAASLAILPGA